MPLFFCKKAYICSIAYLKRHIDATFLAWKKRKNRKPLILRGARQVGKSSAVKQFGKTFKNYVEVNFDENKTIHQFFESDYDPQKIINELSIYFGVTIEPSTTLLFFDEIQTSIPAISSLRYFYEKMPELHVIAAGSLLEFALEELPSFGVGRVRSVYMYPLSFNEFLHAGNYTQLLKAKKEATIGAALALPTHNKLLGLLRQFLIIGGMPEVVKTYFETGKALECQNVLNDIYTSLLDDFAKYKTLVPSSRIADVLQAVVLQNGGKFNYSKTNSNANHRQIKEALDLLFKAGLVIPVTHTSANGIPLGAEKNVKKQKILILDNGLFLRSANLQMGEILLHQNIDLINKGGLAELFVGLEMLKYASPFERQQLFYWAREKPGSSAEIDFVIQQNFNIIPIEVKSGRQGKMQSMWQFFKAKNITKGIRISLENYNNVSGVDILPLYAISELIKPNFEY